MDDTADHVALTRLQSAYADVITRRAFAELAGLFRADAVVRVDARRGEPLELVGPDALGRFVAAALEPLELFEFVILNAVNEIDGAAATGRMYMCELRQSAADHRFSVAYGLYQDRYEKVDGRWWFAGRDYSSLARTSPAADRDLDVFPFPAVPPTRTSDRDAP